jgi:hypothetical protein
MTADPNARGRLDTTWYATRTPEVAAVFRAAAAPGRTVALRRKDALELGEDALRDALGEPLRKAVDVALRSNTTAHAHAEGAALDALEGAVAAARRASPRSGAYRRKTQDVCK